MQKQLAERITITADIEVVGRTGEAGSARDRDAVQLACQGVVLEVSDEIQLRKE